MFCFRLVETVPDEESEEDEEVTIPVFKKPKTPVNRRKSKEALNVTVVMMLFLKPGFHLMWY